MSDCTNCGKLAICDGLCGECFGQGIVNKYNPIAHFLSKPAKVIGIEHWQNAAGSGISLIFDRDFQSDDFEPLVVVKR